MSFETGHKLAHYVIAEPIGKGGMGEVYRANDEKLGRDVAIKVLPETFAADDERLRRFQREAKVLASLNHPGIAAIYGLEQSGETHYLVLELVPGETLAERIARGPIPTDDTIEIALKVSEALEEAHAHGIVHRDLKPANIKLTPDGRVKVLDFGLAKALAEESPDVDSSLSPTITRDATRVGVILGTAAYMSPEQAKGRLVDKRTDNFAFGAVLYEMLTGKKAFPGDDVSDVLAAVLKLEPDWNALPSAVPQNVRNTLRRCLEKDAKRRLHDIADARIELQEIEGEVIEPVASTPKSRPALAAIAFGVAALAFAAGWLWPRSAPSPAVERFSVPVDLGDRSGGLGVNQNMVAASPDGSDVVMSIWNLSGARLYRRSRGELTVTPIENSEGGYGPFFSPDGAWLGFFTTSGELKKMRWPPQGTPVTLCEVRPTFLAGASWGGDGTIVFSDRGRLMRVDAGGGTPTELLTASHEGEVLGSPQLLAGGRTVLFTVRDSDQRDQAALASLETGEWQPLLDAHRSRFVPATGHLVFGRNGSLWAVGFDPAQGNVSGDAVQMVTDVDAFAVGADGSLAYTDAVSLGSQRVVWVDRTGRETPALENSDVFMRPRLSPDGRRLAIEINDLDADDDLWVYDLARQTRTRLTFEGANTDPVWFPDGELVAFTHGPGMDEDIVRRRADGTGELETLVARPTSQNPHSFSPDGRLLAFYERVDETSRDIWILNLDDGETKPFLVTEFNERSPSFSPDSRWLAYTSDESGGDEIYIQAYPGPGAKVTVSRGGGREPVWSRDGKELFYRNGGQVWTVEVGDGRPPRIGEPRLLFEGPYEGGTGVRGSQTYDVSPDGERFLMIKLNESADEDRLIIVLNWTEELKRLVPGE